MPSHEQVWPAWQPMSWFPMWRGRWVGWFYTLDPNAAITRAQ